MLLVSPRISRAVQQVICHTMLLPAVAAAVAAAYVHTTRKRILNLTCDSDSVVHLSTDRGFCPKAFVLQVCLPCYGAGSCRWCGVSPCFGPLGQYVSEVPLDLIWLIMPIIEQCSHTSARNPAAHNPMPTCCLQVPTSPLAWGHSSRGSRPRNSSWLTSARSPCASCMWPSAPL
jgi:hypothetical protein